MANHKSAIKRHKQSIKRNTRNRAARTRVKNVVKQVRAAILNNDKEGALAKTGTTMIIPQDLANLSGIVAGLTSVIRHDGGSSVQTSSAGARKEAAENGNGGAPVNVGGFNFTPPRV